MGRLKKVLASFLVLVVVFSLTMMYRPAPRVAAIGYGAALLKYDAMVIASACAAAFGISVGELVQVPEGQPTWLEQTWDKFTQKTKDFLDWVSGSDMPEVTIPAEEWNDIIQTFDEEVPNEGVNNVSIPDPLDRWCAGDVSELPPFPNGQAIHMGGNFVVFKNYGGNTHAFTTDATHLIYSYMNIQLKTAGSFYGKLYIWNGTQWNFSSNGYVFNVTEAVGHYSNTEGIRLTLHDDTTPISQQTIDSSVTVDHNPALYDDVAQQPIIIPYTSEVVITRPQTLEEINAMTPAQAAEMARVVNNVVEPTDWGTSANHIDFTPLMNIDYFDKFPFCLATGIYDAVVGLVATPAAPVFNIDLAGSPYLLGGIDMEISLEQFSTLAAIARWFELLIFIVALVMITKKVVIV